MVTLGCDMVSVFISNMFPYCGIPRGRGVLRNRNPLFFGSIICVRSALYGSGYSTPLLRASVMIHRHVIRGRIEIFQLSTPYLAACCLPVYLSRTYHCTVQCSLPPYVQVYPVLVAEYHREYMYMYMQLQTIAVANPGITNTLQNPYLGKGFLQQSRFILV